MSKIPISKKVDGNELDLSMSELAIIPVKELVSCFIVIKYNDHNNI